MKRGALLILAGLMAAIAANVYAAGASDLRAFGRGSWEQIRKAHAGAPFVVHFWGVTCAPCRTEMPRWGALAKDRRDLRLVTIDADLVANERAAVKKMLAQSGLSGAENWLFDDAFTERLRYEIDPGWRGEIPRTLLIAADGTATTIEGSADPADVRAWLDRQTPAR